jgi:hypothetical protein
VFSTGRFDQLKALSLPRVGKWTDELMANEWANWSDLL